MCTSLTPDSTFCSDPFTGDNLNEARKNQSVIECGAGAKCMKMQAKLPSTCEYFLVTCIIKVYIQLYRPD